MCFFIKNGFSLPNPAENDLFRGRLAYLQGQKITRAAVPMMCRACLQLNGPAPDTPAVCTTLYRDLASDKTIMLLRMRNLCMRYPGIFLLLAVIACIIIAGCTQVSGTAPVTATAPVASAPPVTPAIEPANSTPVITSTPQGVVTIVHQVSLVKDVKDSERLFSLQVPVEWSPSTYRLDNPENFIGFMYQTDLRKNNTFYIHTFSNYHSREQNYRDECKRWVPAPNESVVTINGLVFDRFESTANSTTNVTYVMRQTDMNERGFLSVLAFSANTSNRFEAEDYDKVVASFRYYGKDDCTTIPGEEITFITPDMAEGGNMRSASSRSSSTGASASSSSKSSCPNRK